MSSRRHGMTNTRVFKIWCGMRRRCTDRKELCFARYGGRGIQVCERWLDFVNFYEDMGEPPSPDHSLERKDPNKGYEPGNVIWATTLEQANNKLNSRKLTYQGRTLTVMQWSRELNLSPWAIYCRLDRGWDDERTLSTPVRQWRKQGRNRDADITRRSA